MFLNRAEMKDGQVVLGTSDGVTAAEGVAGEGGSAAAAAAVTQEQFVIPSQLKQRHLEVDPPPPPGFIIIHALFWSSDSTSLQL